MGRISQTFRVAQNQTTLTVKWNFLSEEFLEHIGSIYQDYFQVVILRQDATEDILLNNPAGSPILRKIQELITRSGPK